MGLGLKWAAMVGMAGTACCVGAGAVRADDGVISIPGISVQAQGGEQATIGEAADAEGITDYRISHGTTGAKADLNSADIPQTVVAIPRKIIEEQNLQTLNDAFRNIAGAQSNQSAVQGAQWPMIRGFEARSFYKDGMRDDTFDRTYWLGNVDRIEVLKGPASVLYGDGSPSGVINVVSKRPLPYSSASGEVWGGNYDTVGTLADASVKVTENGAVLARIIADVSHKDNFVDNFDTSQKHVSALVEARLSDSTALAFGGEYRDRSIDNDVGGQPAYARYMDLPRSYNFEADWSDRTDTGRNVNARLTHHFNDDWKVSTGLLANFYEFDQRLTSFSAFNLATNRVTRSLSGIDTDTREILSDTNVEGKFTLAGLPNTMVVGTDLSYVHNQRVLYTGTLPGGAAALTTTVVNPVTNIAQANWVRGNRQFLLTSRQGFYAQDLVELTPALKVMVGTRYDDVERKYKQITPTNISTASETHDGEWSNRVGATYEIRPGVTAFGGYSHSFVPPGTVITMGTAPDADPEMGVQYEGGIKLDLPAGVTATASVYQLTRKNVRTTDPITSLVTIVGEQESKGVELDASWAVSKGWNMLLAYAYTDASVTKDLVIPDGAGLPNVAAHTGRLWSMYEFQDGPLRGLGLGGGVTYVGKRAVDSNNQFHMPDYATVDMAAYYPISDHVKFSLNANNLLDSKYYVGGYGTSASNSYIYAGEPFTIVGRLKVTY